MSGIEKGCLICGSKRPHKNCSKRSLAAINSADDRAAREGLIEGPPASIGQQIDDGYFLMSLSQDDLLTWYDLMDIRYTNRMGNGRFKRFGNFRKNRSTERDISREEYEERVAIESRSHD